MTKITQAIIRSTLIPYPIQLTFFFMFLNKFCYIVARSVLLRRQRVYARRIRRIKRRIARILCRGAKRSPFFFKQLSVLPCNRTHYNFVRMLC